jgi:hypothetical protein
VTLTDNLRNSREIADAFRPLAGGAFTCAGGSGLPVRHVTVEPGGDVYGAASDIADQLLADGWRTDQVALLTTKHRHPVHREQRESGQDSYWAEFWDGTDIFYGTVNGFKGLERPAVVLAVDGFHGDDRADETMYVGMSRARDLLVVVMEEQGHHATSSAR